MARVAEPIGLGDHLLFSRAEQAAGAAANPAILADACEALIAAIYLDGGFDAAAGFVRRFWEPLVAEMEGPPRDPKTALQEWAQARGLGLPRYELVGNRRPRSRTALHRRGEHRGQRKRQRDGLVQAHRRGRRRGGCCSNNSPAKSRAHCPVDRAAPRLSHRGGTGSVVAVTESELGTTRYRLG